MAKRKSTKTVETLRHEDASRKNIPTAEYQAVMAEDDRNPIRVAYERRNRDLDPQLVWRGKDEQNWSDLVVQAPPLFIQEKVHPKVLIDDLRQRSKETGDGESSVQTDLFADFNGLPSADAQTEFYQHDANWSNRMILGDSLQGMASLAEREGLRGKVQCIYIDPPYGIKFDSNFQCSTTSRDVKDGKGRPHYPRARAGEGVSGYVARWNSFVFDLSARSADGGAGFVDGERVGLRADWGQECTSGAGVDGRGVWRGEFYRLDLVPKKNNATWRQVPRENGRLYCLVWKKRGSDKVPQII